MIKTSRSEYEAGLKALNLKDGQVYIIHSSLLRFGILEDGPEGVLQTLTSLYGNKATFLVPTFTFNYANTRTWCYYNSKSETGALSEYFRKRPGALRTLNPFHSLAVLGYKANEFSEIKSSSSFGVGSSFDLLYRLGAINIGFGIDLVGGATFLHHAEEVAQVHYREYKEFPGRVLDSGGKRCELKYKMYVRKKSPNGQLFTNDWAKVREDLIESGLMKAVKVAHAPIIAFDIRDTHDFVMKKIRSNPNYLLSEQKGK